jgi:hypothetical protein
MPFGVCCGLLRRAKSSYRTRYSRFRGRPVGPPTPPPLPHSHAGAQRTRRSSQGARERRRGALRTAVGRIDPSALEGRADSTGVRRATRTLLRRVSLTHTRRASRSPAEIRSDARCAAPPALLLIGTNCTRAVDVIAGGLLRRSITKGTACCWYTGIGACQTKDTALPSHMGIRRERAPIACSPVTPRPFARLTVISSLRGGIS